METGRTPLVATLLGLLHRAAGLPRARAQRREIGRLGELDDHMLADIGLTRHDLASALSQPLFVDASEILADHVRGSREARRASATEAFAASRRYRGERRSVA